MIIITDQLQHTVNTLLIMNLREVVVYQILWTSSEFTAGWNIQQGNTAFGKTVYYESKHLGASTPYSHLAPFHQAVYSGLTLHIVTEGAGRGWALFSSMHYSNHLGT